jgi:hypothetical protein
VEFIKEKNDTNAQDGYGMWEENPI